MEWDVLIERAVLLAEKVGLDLARVTVVASGSSVRGSGHAFSDLDFYVIGASEPFEACWSVAHCIEGTMCQFNFIPRVEAEEFTRKLRSPVMRRAGDIGQLRVLWAWPKLLSRLATSVHVSGPEYVTEEFRRCYQQMRLYVGVLQISRLVEDLAGSLLVREQWLIQGAVAALRSEVQEFLLNVHGDFQFGEILQEWRLHASPLTTEWYDELQSCLARLNESVWDPRVASETAYLLCRSAAYLTCKLASSWCHVDVPGASSREACVGQLLTPSVVGEARTNPFIAGVCYGDGSVGVLFPDGSLRVSGGALNALVGVMEGDERGTQSWNALEAAGLVSRDELSPKEWLERLGVGLRS